jgi:hypothetical protein
MLYRYSLYADSSIDLQPCSDPLDTQSLRPRLGNVSDKQFVPDYPISTSLATCYLAYTESNLSKYQGYMRDYMAISDLQAEDKEGINSLLLSR